VIARDKRLVARTLKRGGRKRTVRLMKIRLCLVALLPTLLLAEPVSREIAQAAATAVEENYVFPEIGRDIAARIRAKLAEGSYDAVPAGEELARALTADMQAVNGDKHLRVRAATSARRAPQGDGVARVEILPGNIGYVDFRHFPPLAVAEESLRAAMTRVAGARALILDLRRHRGGAPDSVAYVCSHLFGAARVHLNSLEFRGAGRAQEFHTDPTLPGPRFGPDKPVFFLTSSRTFSAGEEFAYNLQTRQRALLVGETTGGGANPGRSHPLPGGFSVFVSNGRAINPVTGTNWEGVGVKPEIAAPAAEAFVIAYEKALAGFDRDKAEPAVRDAIAELLRNPPTPE
jgi:C-terminal processing protease CtpA/Prc